jgi:hypothetical protein
LIVGVAVKIERRLRAGGEWRAGVVDGRHDCGSKSLAEITSAALFPA